VEKDVDNKTKILDEHFRDATKNTSYVHFVNRFRNEAIDMEAFIHSSNKEQRRILFTSMILHLESE
jgi:hypothetical protein